MSDGLRTAMPARARNRLFIPFTLITSAALLLTAAISVDGSPPGTSYLEDGRTLAGQGLATRKDSELTKVTDLTQLCGLNVATGAGTTFEATLEENAHVAHRRQDVRQDSQEVGYDGLGDREIADLAAGDQGLTRHQTRLGSDWASVDRA